MIEVHKVVVHEQQTKHQIADIGGIGGNAHLDGVFQSAGGRQRVGIGAHAAGTLGEVLGIAGITAFEDGFQTAEQGSAAAGILNLAVFHFHFNTKVAFNTGQGVNGPPNRCSCSGAFS